MSTLRQERSVVEIGSRPKRDMLLTPAGGRPSLAGSPLRPDLEKLYASPKWENRANDFLKDASNRHCHLRRHAFGTFAAR